ncbi:hypothetical protein P2318_00575 [Myxococcaceae bacterium GXIMD 01537]
MRTAALVRAPLIALALSTSPAFAQERTVPSASHEPENTRPQASTPKAAMCTPSGDNRSPPELAETLLAQFLVRESATRLTPLTYYIWSSADRTFKVEGAMPLGRRAILVLSDWSGADIDRANIQVVGPDGALKVLAVDSGSTNHEFWLVVERPEGTRHPDGMLYVLTAREKDGPRQFVDDKVTPWPLPAPSSPREPLRNHESSKGNLDDAIHNQEVSRTKAL